MGFLKLIFVLALTTTLAWAQTTSGAFTYQGHLVENGVPANGIYDFKAELIAADLSVTAVDDINDVPVTDGLFTIEIDFGVGALTRQFQSLRLRVKQDADNTFTTLSDQPFRVTPKSEWARSSGTTLQQAADNGPNVIVTDDEGLLLTPNPSSSRTTTLQLEGQDSLLAHGRGEFNGLLTLNDGLTINDAPVNFTHRTGFEQPVTLEPYFFNDLVRGIDIFFPSSEFTHRFGATGYQIIGTSTTVPEVLVDFLPGIEFGMQLKIGEIDAESIYADDLYVDGPKNFIMDHPTDDEKDIVYAAVEGPEAGAYCRGTAKLIDGRARIEFDEHFSLVMNPETMTVQVTPKSAESLGLAVIERDLNGFTVRELHKGTGTYEFDWHATAVRRGFENYQPVREKMKRRSDQ